LSWVAWLVAIWSSRVSTSESTREMKKEATERMAARSRPVIDVHPASLRPAARADHRAARSPRPHGDHVARVLDILDDQHRQTGKHSPRKPYRVNHDRS
jgi:hypothetical protein